MAAPEVLPPGDWARLRALLDEALALPPEARRPWLEGLAPEHLVWRERLRSLLGHSEGGAALLDTRPRAETADFAAPPGGAMPAAVGPYRLLRELGHGGMARVWLAERTDMLQQRQVALKLPYRDAGGWRDAALAGRLAREREILATLEHPHIARLYDAGVAADGQPWLALEFVAGERIDIRATTLPVPQRLRLFVQAVRAVAHAHAQLVVHRDIKPANMLVTASGELKLLDFGIAKLLDQGVAEATELTQQAGRAFTPQYASPEQIRGEALGTGTDIFSLGVVLYELLAGQRPFGAAGANRAQLEDAVLHQEPRRPSEVASASTARALRGDLDTIVLKALKKAPRERYATADALANDIERHLAHQPVLAQPDSLGYRLRRFLQRNRLPVAAASVVVLALTGGAVVALWQAHEARLAQARAEEETQAAQRARGIATASASLSDYLSNDLAAQRTSSEIEAQLDRAAAMVRVQYAEQALLRAHLLYTLAGRHRRLANFEKWRVMADEALVAAQAAGDGRLGSDISCRRARDTAQAGQVAVARQAVDTQLAWLQQQQPSAEPELLACLTEASAIARMSGDGERAVQTAQQMRELEVRGGAEQTSGHGETLFILARAQSLVGQHAQAMTTLRAGLDLFGRLNMQDSVQARNLRAMMATVLREGGQPLRAIDMLAPLLQQHAGRGGASAGTAVMAMEHGNALVRSGQAAQAVPQLEQALDEVTQRGDSSGRRAAAMALVAARLATGEPARARQVLQQVEEAYAPLIRDRVLVATALHLARAELALAEADGAAALAHADDAAAIASPRAGAGEAFMRRVHRVRARAALLPSPAAAQDALAHALQALAISRRHAIDPEASLSIGEDLLLVALARRAAGDNAGADGDDHAAHVHLAATAPARDPARGPAQARFSGNAPSPTR